MSAIQLAIKKCGCQGDLARAIGVTQSAISQFSTGRRPVPAALCSAIEVATKGEVTREQLRPDIFK